MTFFRTYNKINFDYLIQNEYLLRVDKVKDLGFTLLPSLSFNNHIQLIICKTLCILRFICRNTSDFDQAKCLSLLYTSLIRLILEYRSVVWSPYTRKDIQRIERIQKHFFSFAGYLLKIYHPYIIIHQYWYLNLLTLKARRKMLDIRFISNLVHDKINASHLLDRVILHISKIGSRNK